eukprot:2146641-Pleurochrysis_carterae.AAC.2
MRLRARPSYAACAGAMYKPPHRACATTTRARSCARALVLVSAQCRAHSHAHSYAPAHARAHTHACSRAQSRTQSRAQSRAQSRVRLCAHCARTNNNVQPETIECSFMAFGFCSFTSSQGTALIQLLKMVYRLPVNSFQHETMRQKRHEELNTNDRNYCVAKEVLINLQAAKPRVLIA